MEAQKLTVTGTGEVVTGDASLSQEEISPRSKKSTPKGQKRSGKRMEVPEIWVSVLAQTLRNASEQAKLPYRIVSLPSGNAAIVIEGVHWCQEHGQLTYKKECPICEKNSSE